MQCLFPPIVSCQGLQGLSFVGKSFSKDKSSATVPWALDLGRQTLCSGQNFQQDGVRENNSTDLERSRSCQFTVSSIHHLNPTDAQDEVPFKSLRSGATDSKIEREIERKIKRTDLLCPLSALAWVGT